METSESNPSEVYSASGYVCTLPEGYTDWTLCDDCIIAVSPDWAPRVFDLRTREWSLLTGEMP